MSEQYLRQILVVDDESQILAAIQRELKAPPRDIYEYRVEGFVDPATALQRVREKPFDAVISDYRMPGMDGIEFLRQVAEIQPDCARIVLSGQADTGALVRCVNEIHAYRFIPKPWSAYYLKASLGQALDYGAVLAEHRRLAGMALGLAVAQESPRACDKVLVVDDDMAVLNAIARSLRSIAATDAVAQAIRAEATGRAAAAAPVSIEIQLEQSPLRALELAESANFSCILADQHMPEMEGVDLLKRFAVQHPDCARILISGGIGQDDLIQAVNAVHIFAFIEKPWDDFEMKKTLLLALSQRHMRMENRRLAKLFGANAVAPTPSFAELDENL